MSMHGRPTAGELLAAVTEFLRDEVSPHLDGTLKHQVRIAVHALEVVGRELELGPAQLDAHLARLRALGVADDATLAEATRQGRLDGHPELIETLRADTRDRLLVANPGWLPPERE
jgi:hypothetical protein